MKNTKAPLAILILLHCVRRDGLEKWVNTLHKWKEKYAQGLSITKKQISNFSCGTLYSMGVRQALPLEKDSSNIVADEIIATHLLATQIPDNIPDVEASIKNLIEEYHMAHLGEHMEIINFVAKVLTYVKMKQLNALPTDSVTAVAA